MYTEYIRKEIYGVFLKNTGSISRTLCAIEIIEVGYCIDHLYMLVKISPKYNVLQVVWYFKGMAH